MLNKARQFLKIHGCYRFVRFDMFGSLLKYWFTIILDLPKTYNNKNI